jgi:hypothetical protein
MKMMRMILRIFFSKKQKEFVLQKNLVYIYCREIFSHKRNINIEGGGIHGSKKEGQEGNSKEEDRKAKEEVVLLFYFVCK